MVILVVGGRRCLVGSPVRSSVFHYLGGGRAAYRHHDDPGVFAGVFQHVLVRAELLAVVVTKVLNIKTRQKTIISSN